MMLSRASLSRPAAAPGASRRLSAPRMAPAVVLARATPKEQIEQAQQVLEKTLKEAEEACDKAGAKSDECAVAFDAVEEVSAAIAHKKAASKGSDPLEQFCDDNPDADECRVYDD